MFKKEISLVLALTLLLGCTLPSNAAWFSRKNAKNSAQNVQKVNPKAENKAENKTKKQKPKKEEAKTDYIHLLELNDEQKAYYDTLRHEEFEQISPLVEKIKVKHTELEKIIESDISPEIAEIEEGLIKKDIKEIRAQIREIRTQTEQKIEGILNEKQKAKYKKIKHEANLKEAKQTPARSMNSVSVGETFEIKPCDAKGEKPACKLEDVIK